MNRDNATTTDVIDPLEAIEIDLLFQAICRYYGFDFRGYALASRKRRLLQFIQQENIATISGLQERLLHDRETMERLLLTLSINVTSMFRDPEFFNAFREHAVPILRTYPFIRLWHAGCSSGEEVYSMAILLQESGLLAKTKIYATDMNLQILKRAKKGIFPLQAMQEYTTHYLLAGGSRNFSHYYSANDEQAIMSQPLKNNIVFAHHNLVTDTVFNEFNAVICRNVLIYFNQELQNRVLQLFHDSLCRFGVLGLGTKETVDYSTVEKKFKGLYKQQKLFRRND